MLHKKLKAFINIQPENKDPDCDENIWQQDIKDVKQSRILKQRANP